jgi:lysophospholipase L1-like esterase
MDAEVGRSTEDGRRVLNRRRSEVHQVAVVFLGNNYGGDEVAFADEIDRILGLLDAVPRVLLVTVQENRKQQAEVNDVLWEKAAGRPGQVQLVDWASLAATRDDINGPDGLHLNDKGTVLLASLLGQALGLAPSLG